VRVIKGPWEAAESLTMGATGPRASGSSALPTIIVAAWVAEGELWTATSLDSGRGWTPPMRIDQDVDASWRPRVALALGRPVIAYTAGGRLKTAERTAEGWIPVEVGPSAPFDLVVQDWEPSLAWNDGGVIVWDGVAVGEGACPDSAPALSSEGLLAWRTEAGVVLDGSLEERGGGCVSEPPVFDGEVLMLTVEGVLHRGDEVLPPVLEGRLVEQPRAAGGATAWVEVHVGEQRAVLQGTGLLTHTSILLGDPVQVSGEVWLPFIAGQPVVAAWSPPPIP